MWTRPFWTQQYVPLFWQKDFATLVGARLSSRAIRPGYLESYYDKQETKKGI
jgi:hypothetical protein